MTNKWVNVLGFVLLIVGILGFFNNPVLGIFDATTTHSIIHVVIGLIVLAWSMVSPESSRGLGKLFGVIFLIVAIVGLVSSKETLFGLVLGGANNFLFLIVGFLFLYLGLGESKKTNTPASMS